MCFLRVEVLFPETRDKNDLSENRNYVLGPSGFKDKTTPDPGISNSGLCLFCSLFLVLCRVSFRLCLLVLFFCLAVVFFFSWCTRGKRVIGVVLILVYGRFLILVYIYVYVTKIIPVLR